MPPKLVSKNEVYKYLSHLVQTTYTEGVDWLYEADKGNKKMVILLDECQNLFLSQVGGFEGFKAFVEILNLRTKNIFWCVAFNRQSWNYLFDVFGKHQFFRSVEDLDEWSDSDIQKLIEKRHKRSGFLLSYDQIISAASSEKKKFAYAHIEKKFFQLLWEESGGNPRAAIHLWLSSLVQINKNTLRVGLPQDEDDFYLAQLQDDLHFVYAELAKHENLNIDEAVAVTNLTQSLVRHALKIGLEREFLGRSDDGRYRILSRAQDRLLKHLASKNFIYGYTKS